VAKKPEDVQFLAINCHVHDIVVAEPGRPGRTGLRAGARTFATIAPGPDRA